jgi:hypothetical protein
MLFAFNNTWSGDQEERAAANRQAADFKRNRRFHGID